MNKQDLIDAILANKEAGIESKAAAGRAVDAVLDGFCSFLERKEPKELPAREVFLEHQGWFML